MAELRAAGSLAALVVRARRDRIRSYISLQESRAAACCAPIAAARAMVLY